MKNLGKGFTASFLCLLVSTRVVLCVHGMAFQIRQAASKDVFLARKVLFQEGMNPLSISDKTLLVATLVEDSNSRIKSANEDVVVGFGQIRSLDGIYSELASLFVFPQYRKQGIGTALVKELLQRYDTFGATQKVCLLTLRPTVPFYESHGFVVQPSMEDLPNTIQLEFKAGSFLSSLLGNDICCMVRDEGTHSRETLPL